MGRKATRYITIAKYAERCGMSKMNLHKMAREGKIPFKVRNGERVVDCTILDPVLMPHNKKANQELKQEQDNINLMEAERRKKVFEAHLKELQYKEKKGELINLAKASKVVFEGGRKCRDAILNIPSRISPELAAETDPFKVEIMLTKELKQALEHLSINLKK